MDNNKTFDDLIYLMLTQAKKFLEEIGEFFPYSSVLKSDTTLKTLGIYNTIDENFSATNAIDILSKDIKKSIKNDEILLGAIGIDVTVNGDENAILIKVTEDGDFWHEKYFLYSIINNIIEIENYNNPQ